MVLDNDGKGVCGVLLCQVNFHELTRVKHLMENYHFLLKNVDKNRAGNHLLLEKQGSTQCR